MVPMISNYPVGAYHPAQVASTPQFAGARPPRIPIQVSPPEDPVDLAEQLLSLYQLPNPWLKLRLREFSQLLMRPQPELPELRSKVNQIFTESRLLQTPLAGKNPLRQARLKDALVSILNFYSSTPDVDNTRPLRQAAQDIEAQWEAEPLTPKELGKIHFWVAAGQVISAITGIVSGMMLAVGKPKNHLDG